MLGGSYQTYTAKQATIHSEMSLITVLYSNPGAIPWWSRFKLSHEHWHSIHVMSHCVTGWVTWCCTSNATSHMDVRVFITVMELCNIWCEGMNVVAETTLYCYKCKQLFWVCAVSVSMFSQALSQALPLHPHTCADLGYCSNTLVNVSCDLDLPVHGDEVHACN